MRKLRQGMGVELSNFDSHVMTGGRALGYTRGLGAGWAEQVLGHRSMLHPIPEGVSEPAASLHEPISIAMHGLAHHPPEEGAPILIVGGGVIGLSALLAVRAYFPDNPATVLLRYPHQAEAARACGATEVVMGSGAATFEELAALTGGRAVGDGDDRMLMGGFAYVIECAGGHSAMTDALRAADHRGTVLTLGATGIGKIDMTPSGTSNSWWWGRSITGRTRRRSSDGRPRVSTIQSTPPSRCWHGTDSRPMC